MMTILHSAHSVQQELTMLEMIDDECPRDRGVAANERHYCMVGVSGGMARRGNAVANTSYLLAAIP